MRAILIAVLHVAIFLALPFRAYAQEKPKEGDTVTAPIAVCETTSDAATLLGIVTKYGQNTAMGWMREDDNTCILAPLTFTIGAIEVSGMKDKKGVEWVIITVKAGDKSLFAVIPHASLATPASL